MKVYIVMWAAADEWEIHSVWSTREKAAAAANELGHTDTSCSYFIKEWEVKS